MSEKILEAAERHMQALGPNSTSREHLGNCLATIRTLRTSLDRERKLKDDCTQSLAGAVQAIIEQKQEIKALREAANQERISTALAPPDYRSKYHELGTQLCAIYDAMNLTGEHRCPEGAIAEYVVQKDQVQTCSKAYRRLEADHYGLQCQSATELAQKENLVRIVQRLAPHTNCVPIGTQPCTCWKSKFMTEANLSR